MGWRNSFSCDPFERWTNVKTVLWVKGGICMVHPRVQRFQYSLFLNNRVNELSDQFVIDATFILQKLVF